MQNVAFKEWAVVCQALAEGRQNIILRKGGIAEGRGGFAFRHREFFLFPTYFHEEMEKTRLPEAVFPEPSKEQIEIRFFARVESETSITSWEILEALEPFHILHPSVVRERFNYKERAQLHIAFVRVFRLNPSWILPNEKSFGGCRSWVQLPECPAATCFEPVISDAEHAKRIKLFGNRINLRTRIAAGRFSLN